MVLVFLCLTKFTIPNLPSPNFLYMMNSSTIFALLVKFPDILRLILEIEGGMLDNGSSLTFSFDLCSINGDELNLFS